MDKAIIIEMIKLFGVIASSMCASGGILIFFLKKYDRVSNIEKSLTSISEGLELTLQNDIVIFKALREGHINGESEKQEEKMKEYFFRNTTQTFCLKENEK